MNYAHAKPANFIKSLKKLTLQIVIRDKTFN